MKGIRLDIVVLINSDEDCQDVERERSVAHLVKFSSRVAYGQEGCSVNVHSPWFSELQNGFGVFLAKKMDCGSMVTVQCLPDSDHPNQVRHHLFVLSSNVTSS
jgi:hypothetical protein